MLSKIKMSTKANFILEFYKIRFVSATVLTTKGFEYSIIDTLLD